jgi:hypothetical protein
MNDFYGQDLPLLGATAVHPSVAAPLLFLISEQNPDAREAARFIQGREAGDITRTALIETICDLASERLEQILERATRLQRLRVVLDGDPDVAIEQALYGLCWAGIVQLAAHLLNREAPEMTFRRFDTPQNAFEEVERLSRYSIALDGEERRLDSVYSGPRHLARLLRSAADQLSDTGIVYLPTPGNADATFWSRWLRHRARSKPILWRNHRAAVNSGFLQPGRSAVLVLPTGAGKTTLSELKIAATLASGGKVVFLVPTLALVEQLRDDLSESFPTSFADVEVSVDGDLTGLLAVSELQSIEVMTPDRCLALMSHNASTLTDVRLVIFDECHLLSPQGGGKRSLDAMLCLLQVIKKVPDANLLLLSAMLTNADEFADWIAEITERPCSAFVDRWKPSRQARGIVIYSRGELWDLTRAAQGHRHGTSRPGVTPYALFGLHQNWNPDANADTRVIKLSDQQLYLSLNAQGRPTPTANHVAAQLAERAAVIELKTIVFVQQAAYAPSVAKKIADELPAIENLSESERALWASIAAEFGGVQYSLVDPTRAALPHNGDMITLERRLVESLFRKANGAVVIVATPTLAQGMNLPAQLAILAGDKRHDADGRSPLESHEILNAAGRAGRAGYLANGVVIMIPEPVVAFSDNGSPEASAFRKLSDLLPPNDQCVRLEDPLTAILDRIQLGNVADVDISYFVSRIRPIEETQEARDEALAVMRRSFSGFLARRANRETEFNGKVEALRTVLSAERPLHAEVAVIAAASGFSDEPLMAIEAKLEQGWNALPTSILAWSDWLMEFLKADRQSYRQLMGDDTDTALYIMRGKKTGGDPTVAEFDRLKLGMRAWLTGLPFCEIERSLGAEEHRIKQCPRARDLALKLASRSLYLIIAAVAEVANVVLARHEATTPQPSLFEVLPTAFRRGFDTADKVAFAQARSDIRSRVLVHQAFRREIGAPLELGARSFIDVVDLIKMRLALGA